MKGGDRMPRGRWREDGARTARGRREDGARTARGRRWPGGLGGLVVAVKNIEECACSVVQTLNGRTQGSRQRSGRALATPAALRRYWRMHMAEWSGESVAPHTILVVEDDPIIQRVLQTTLELEGFSSAQAETGEVAIQIALREVPHLILLDLMLPGMDGFEVVRQLRANVKTAHIPVLMLSARHDTADKVRAFDTSVDDYLTKPFNIEELLARIRMQLRRVQENLLSPLTGLPGGVQVERAIEQKLREEVPWAILYLDLDHFKAYNDVYGFVRGNDLIRLLAHVASDAVRESGNVTDFLGHVGGDDFVLITTPERLDFLCARLIDQFDVQSRALYTEDDLRRGALSALDRQGHQRLYPLVTLSIGVVTNQHRAISSMEEVSRVAAEVKRKAKEALASSYFVDRRGSSDDLLGPEANLPAAGGQEVEHPCAS
jgi:diguanylate cyclase (GGDEF)-like protein